MLADWDAGAGAVGGAHDAMGHAVLGCFSQLLFELLVTVRAAEKDAILGCWCRCLNCSDAGGGETDGRARGQGGADAGAASGFAAHTNGANKNT